MTSVEFFADKKGINGFKISGHCSSDGDDEIGKIVCAAVSSAAYMTANTIIEVVGCKCDTDIEEAYMKFKVSNPNETCYLILKGFYIHINQLSGQYDNKIKIFGGADHVKD